jgi:hypothetical protein
MDQIDIRAKLPRDAHCLGISAGIVIEQNRFEISHHLTLHLA